MRPRYAFFAFVLTASAVASARAQAPDQAPSQPGQPAQTSQAAPDQSAQASPSQQAKQSPQTLAPRRHRVFTNEDFDNLPHEANVNGGRELLDQVNSCDRACFDQVARALGTYSFDTRAKQTLLNAVDKAKEDLPWQGLLGEAIANQYQSCELQMKKKQDFDRFADPRTVTHKELMVDREYEPKFREMTRRLNEVAARANARIRQITDPFVAEFMRVQLSRVLNANCQIFVTELPERRDPDDPDPADSPSDDANQ